MTLQQLKEKEYAIFQRREFCVGGYKFLHGRQSEVNGGPSDHWSVWKWNGYYWQLFIHDATSDFESAQHATRMHVCG